MGLYYVTRKLNFILGPRAESIPACGGAVLSSNPLKFEAEWLCEKCGAKRKWDGEDLAGIENSLAARLDDNENDIKV